jgi:hypothetical protein
LSKFEEEEGQKKKKGRKNASWDKRPSSATIVTNDHIATMTFQHDI